MAGLGGREEGWVFQTDPLLLWVGQNPEGAGGQNPEGVGFQSH